MVVGPIAKPPSFDGGRRFVLKAMLQTRKQFLNLADPVIQMQQRIDIFHIIWNINLVWI